MCLDAVTIKHYIDLSAWVDLDTQNLTAASLSDVARIALLHEFGGVWADATTVCNIALDEWLPDVLQEGFFAFEVLPFPQEGRPISSWFLAAEVGNKLIGKWAHRVRLYWQAREETDDYFWLHHLFFELLEQDAIAARDWGRVPRLSASGPHSVQFSIGFDTAWDRAKELVDWTVPLFKLTYRCQPEALRHGSFLWHLFNTCAADLSVQSDEAESGEGRGRSCALLSVSTQNRGDHVQVLAARALMERIGLKVGYHLDRDNEIRSASALPAEISNLPILMNGWHKTNRKEWPPNAALSPVFLGFHIRLFQCPELLSEEAIDYYRKHGPVGCRDVYTHKLLQSKGVESFVSHCLSLIFSRRLDVPSSQTETFVVSRDERILDVIPKDLGPVTFVNHYSETTNFEENLATTIELLERYRSKAKLIITTLLHCALPAIAMGIPVVVLYPHNNESGHASDLERLGSLSRLVRIYHFDNEDEIDWRGHVVDVSARKLQIIEEFLKLSRKWNSTPPPIGPIAPSASLPVPSRNVWVERRREHKGLQEQPAALSEKWGQLQSYRPEWAERAEVAAGMIPSGVSLLEVGAGAGDLEALVTNRTRYVGTDLNPVNPGYQKLNIDSDMLPEDDFDYAVCLGVFEYLHQPRLAAVKLCRGTKNIIVSYCCRMGCTKDTFAAVRRARGWLTDFSKQEFEALFLSRGFMKIEEQTFNSAEDFEQFVFHFRKLDG